MAPLRRLYRTVPYVGQRWWCRVGRKYKAASCFERGNSSCVLYLVFCDRSQDNKNIQYFTCAQS